MSYDNIVPMLYQCFQCLIFKMWKKCKRIQINLVTYYFNVSICSFPFRYSYRIEYRFHFLLSVFSWQSFSLLLKEFRVGINLLYLHMHTGCFVAVFCSLLRLAISSVFTDIDKWVCIYIKHVLNQCADSHSILVDMNFHKIDICV